MVPRILRIFALIVLVAAVIAVVKFYFFRAPPSAEPEIKLVMSQP